MAELTELQIEFVSQEIKMRGVDLHDLHEDLLDHICTSIESRMDQGDDFESAYEHTMKLFGPGGLMQVQEQTLTLLTQMNGTMKKLSFGFGLAATALLLAGMIFKIQHWPGAGVLLVTGNFLLVALYLPMMLVHKLREAKKDDYMTLWLGFIGLAMFATGTTFKLMHWPMGSILLVSGFLALTLGFMPLYFFKRYKSSANKSITLTTAMLVLVGVIQVGQLLNLKNSMQYHHATAVMNEVMQTDQLMASANTQLIEGLGENVAASTLSEEANKLVEKIDDQKAYLISLAAEVPVEQARNIPLAHIEKLDAFDIPTRVMIGNYENPSTHEHSAMQLKMELDQFRTLVVNTYEEPVRSSVEPIIGFRTDETYTSVYGRQEDWVRYHFHQVTLAAAVTHLTKLQWEIRQAQNQALIYLMNQSEAPGPPSSEA